MRAGVYSDKGKCVQGTKKTQREDDATGLSSPAPYFCVWGVRIFDSQKHSVLAVQLCVGSWVCECTHAESAVPLQEK